MEPSFLREEIARLRVEAERESDLGLRKEHYKTIRHLHRQYRKATRHRAPWFGFLRITGSFLVVFLLALWGVVKLTKTYGREETITGGWLACIAFVLISVTMLVMLRLISADTYSTVVGGALKTLQSILGVKPETSDTEKTDARPAELPKPIESSSSIQHTPHVSFDEGGADGT
ncbi:hypothetical protein [Terriglobus roseus]|uniref:Holin-X, holin superfamily III n=1 Tax=Terriglobus roseus TaxID=392734 RepID=A0A1G7QPZ3_9BACT|nr:hypothetical protein [Terriglobus roseus]SDG00572.1 hypothetical protein SAMN05444167_3954 [Terriglobus roseus]